MGIASMAISGAHGSMAISTVIGLSNAITRFGCFRSLEGQALQALESLERSGELAPELGLYRFSVRLSDQQRTPLCEGAAFTGSCA